MAEKFPLGNVKKYELSNRFDELLSAAYFAFKQPLIRTKFDTLVFLAS